LRDKGYDSYIFQFSDLEERNWYVVRIGDFDDLGKASFAASQYRTKENKTVYITYKDSLTVVEPETAAPRKIVDYAHPEIPKETDIEVKHPEDKILTTDIPLETTQEDDKYNGPGIYTHSNGSKYVGEFKDDKKHGQGTLTYPDGKKYVGEFRDGKKHGWGTLSYPDGKKYVGEFINGKFNGRGTLILTDGCRYEGEFKDGKINGKGTVTAPDERKYEGEFKDGKVVGQGMLILPDGTKHIGEFKNGKFVTQ
jgi:hypothetical protein